MDKITPPPLSFKNVSKLIVLLCLLALFSCEKEMYDYSYKENRSVDKFFSNSIKEPIIDGVINFLKVKNDSLDFVPRFIEKYGIPSWDNSVYVSEERNYLLVPFKNPSKKEIEGVWLFAFSPNNRIHSIPIVKQKTGMNDHWTFDYFTCDVLKKTPKSGLVFDCPKTKGFADVIHCTFGTIEVGGYTVQQEPHCWNDVMYLMDASSNSSSQGGSGDDYISGGGGGGASQPIDVDPKNIDVIVKSPVVVERMKAIWNAILSSLDPQKGRREVGCYVYYDTVNKVYVMGDLKYGDYVTGDEGTHGSVLPGSAQPSHNGVDKGLIPVTFIHGHTPLSYLSPEVSRTVGPSPNDLQWSKDCSTGIIVLDYVGKVDPNDPNKMIIIGGHDKNDPRTEYLVNP